MTISNAPVTTLNPLAAVISFHYPTWDEFRYTDVHPSWWKSWYKYAYSDKEKDVAALLHSCMVNCKGPKFPGEEPPPPTSLEDGYETSTHVLPAWKKITNYSKEHILSILKCAGHQFEGLTQESNLEMAEAEEEENWGGLEEDNNLTIPHNCYYETVKHATHETCNLLDNIHSSVSPSCALSLYTEY